MFSIKIIPYVVQITSLEHGYKVAPCAEKTHVTLKGDNRVVKDSVMLSLSWHVSLSQGEYKYWVMDTTRYLLCSGFFCLSSVKEAFPSYITGYARIE